MGENFDAVLVLSFGGPEKHEDVLPFLETVLRGKNVPRERMLEVAEHYYHFDGRSPINDQNRVLIAALTAALDEHGPRLPVYWGNRNWHPFLADTLREMRDAGVKRALAYVTSAFSSYSGCRQYLEDIERARAAVGADAPAVEKLRGFHDDPGFIETMVDRVRNASPDPDAKLIFTAHSVPLSMASTSPYVKQLEEACALVAAGLGKKEWTLAYQSRSGPPTQPWLEPDVLDVLRSLPRGTSVVVAPIGFISDHMEVLYDLDTEAAQLAEELGLPFERALTAGSHPRFVRMIRDMIQERVSGACSAKICAPDCCPAPQRLARPVA